MYLSPGTRIADRFRIESRLGKGGMATVYRAHDEALGEVVAIKVLDAFLGRDARMVEQFKQEIRLARKVIHPNVCRIHDFRVWNDLNLVTMALISGHQLSVFLVRTPDLGRRLEVFRDILVGVRAAHASGIVHQDLKPGNVMVDDEGHTIVMDFGLAVPADAAGSFSDGQVLGTPAYMAPEQLQGFPADPRSDIYALGVILYEVLTSKCPFDGTTTQNVVEAKFGPLPDAPRDVAEGIPSDLSEICMKMIAAEPEDRFGSLDEVLAAVGAVRLDPDRKVVLVVDDDPDIVEFLQNRLHDAGIVVATAGNGEEAIEKALRERPNLILLDLDLPVMDGFTVAEYLRRHRQLKKVPIFMITANDNPQYAKYATSLGLERFFTKPFSVREVQREILERLGK